MQKQLESKDKVSLKLYDVTAWLTNNCNVHIGQLFQGNQTMKVGQIIEYNKGNIFLQKSC